MSSEAIPPLYSFSAPSPLYSTEPSSEEQRLEHTPRIPIHTTPTGKFTKKAKFGSLVLNDQDENASMPSFSRNAVVSGELHLEKCEHIASICLRLEGRVELSISEGGSRTRTLLSDEYTLWRNSEGTSCPSTVPFACIFPSSYTEDSRSLILPPSYAVSYVRVPGLHVKCIYTLSVVITKTRHKSLAFWPKKKTLTVTVNYYPRTRPPRPILPISSLLTTVKYSPEEWFQVLCTMESRPGSPIQPITCQLFIPSVRIYGLGDTIPFHLQLLGPLSSLRALMPLDAFQTNGSVQSSSGKGAIPKPKIRVFLLRQVTVEVRAQKAWRTCILGEGKMWPLPPMASSSMVHLPPQEESLNWEGEVRCKEDVNTGGFHMSKLVVKDFIVVALTPPNPHTSPLLELQHAQPIRLVTDSWIDVPPPEHWG